MGEGGSQGGGELRDAMGWAGEGLRIIAGHWVGASDAKPKPGSPGTAFAGTIQLETAKNAKYREVYRKYGRLRWRAAVLTSG